MESASKERLCIIGAGPSALSLLYHLKKCQSEDQAIPEVVCFERTEDVGGQWNYTDETGKDQVLLRLSIGLFICFTESTILVYFFR